MYYQSKSEGDIAIENMAIPHRINAALKIMSKTEQKFTIPDTDIIAKLSGQVFGIDNYVEYAAKLVRQDIAVALEASRKAYSMLDKNTKDYALVGELLNINLENV